MIEFNSVDELLQQAASRPTGEELQLTVRDLVNKWGWERRGSTAVHRIRHDLEMYGLTTEPDFEFGWIDNHVRLVKLEKTAPSPERDIISKQLEDAFDGSLKVGVVESAVCEHVVSVEFNSTLEQAQSLMIKNNFSQLPVMKGKREVMGAISWESIAIAKMHNASSTLKDCITSVHVVKKSDELLPLIPEITKHGYIVVINPDKTISGIVTSSDISDEFVTMAGPFLLVGECERHLRTIIDYFFDPEEVRDARVGSDDSREVNGPEDLTFGEMSKLFETDEIWHRLKWQADKANFLEALDEVRKVRNNIMHFSTDPITVNDRNSLDNLLRWLKAIVNSLP